MVLISSVRLEARARNTRRRCGDVWERVISDPARGEFVGGKRNHLGVVIKPSKDMNQNQSVVAKLDDFLLLCFFSHMYGFQAYQNVGHFSPVSRTRGRGERELRGVAITVYYRVIE